MEVKVDEVDVRIETNEEVFEQTELFNEVEVEFEKDLNIVEEEIEFTLVEEKYSENIEEQK
jgi:hypothetical protein